MGYVGTIPFREHWTALTSGRDDYIIENYVQPKAEALFFEESPFAKALVSGAEYDTLAPEWETKRDWPRELTAAIADAGGGNYTITFSGYWNGVALDVAHLKQLIAPRTPLFKLVDGWPQQVQIKTTETIDSLTLDIESVDGGTITADTAATQYRIGATPWAATDEFRQPMALERDKENTYMQTFRVEVEIDEIDEYLAERTVTDPWKERVDDALRNLGQQKAEAFVWQKPAYYNGAPISGYSTKWMKMAGLLWWIQKVQADQANANIYVNANGARPNADAIQDILYHLQMDELANFGQCGYQVWGHPSTMRWPHLWEREFRKTDGKNTKVGFVVKSVGTNTTVAGQYKDGEVEFYSDRRFPENMMIIVPTKRIKHGHFKNGKIKYKDVPTNFMGKQQILREIIAGLAPINPREIGCYYNLASYSA